MALLERIQSDMVAAMRAKDESAAERDPADQDRAQEARGGFDEAAG